MRFHLPDVARVKNRQDGSKFRFHLIRAPAEAAFGFPGEFMAYFPGRRLCWLNDNIGGSLS